MTYKHLSVNLAIQALKEGLQYVAKWEKNCLPGSQSSHKGIGVSFEEAIEVISYLRNSQKLRQ